MKKKHILLSAVLPAIMLLASSCSNYLDELPDNRTDLNTEQAIAKLLVPLLRCYCLFLVIAIR